MNDREWSERKAHDMIAHEVLVQAKTSCPCDRFGEGMIQGFYALGLLTDSELSSYTLILRNTVADRLLECLSEQRKARTESHPAALERAA